MAFLPDCCTTVWKITFYKACSRWLTLKVTPGRQNCHCSVCRMSFLITTSLACTVSKMLPLYCVRDMPATLKSPSVSMRQLSLQAVFTCKHLVVNTCCISQGMGIKKFSDGKSDLQGHSNHCCWCHSVCHIWFPIVFLPCTFNKISFFPRNLKVHVSVSTPSSG